ncbi:TPA: hypothetical protein QDC55_001069 [Burkholderia cenocepacia]|nr:hypothetical protein [Burkholderia cenocepacia]HDR9810532.1 hypothetical protein [Burkholderia cenocepacia]HDR9816668.1 hypothetical protein [Burkholderia cenocepacia]HDR9827549.1 hypothetical protein [Burkholderia cenocepacia]
MRTNHFTRPTFAAAIALLDASLSQAKFNHLVFRLGLEVSIPIDDKVSVSKKAASLAREVAKTPNTHIATANGVVTLVEAVVREAVEVMRAEPTHEDEQNRLIRALALDGFVVQFVDRYSQLPPTLRAALPNEVDLPAADDEVHQLLNDFGFGTPKGHLDQAIEAHTRGDWAAANSQIRTFLESLFDAIAYNIDAANAPQASSENCRQWLATQQQFLSIDRNEWNPDGKSYINGLFKMLHTEGSHPGLSDEERSTFRLHIVLVTARTFLRRLKYRK